MNYQNVNRVMIGSGTTTGTTLTGLAKGDLVLVDEGNNILTAAGAGALSKFAKVRVAMGLGDGEFILSSEIQGDTVSKYTGTNYAAPTEQVTYVGYDGSNASFDIANDAESDYRLRIAIKDDIRIHGQRKTLQDFFYTTGTATAAEDIAFGILKQTDTSNQRAEDRNWFLKDLVKVEVVIKGTAGTAFSATASVVNGSKVVKSTGHGQTVGNIIRFSAVDTDPAFKIAKIVDANTFELETPYTGNTNPSVTAAGIAPYTSITNIGFKISGKPQSEMLSRYSTYEWIAFEAGYARVGGDLDGSGDGTDVAPETTTAGNPGQGYWKQVRDIEESALGYLGQTSKRRFDDNLIATQVDSANNYASIIITHSKISRSDFQGVTSHPLQTEIYAPGNSDQVTNTGENFLAVLNAFFNGVVGLPAIGSLTVAN